MSGYTCTLHRYFIMHLVACKCNATQLQIENLSYCVETLGGNRVSTMREDAGDAPAQPRCLITVMTGNVDNYTYCAQCRHCTQYPSASSAWGT